MSLREGKQSEESPLPPRPPLTASILEPLSTPVPSAFSPVMSDELSGFLAEDKLSTCALNFLPSHLLKDTFQQIPLPSSKFSLSTVPLVPRPGAGVSRGSRGGGKGDFSLECALRSRKRPLFPTHSNPGQGSGLSKGQGDISPMIQAGLVCQQVLTSPE